MPFLTRTSSRSAQLESRVKELEDEKQKLQHALEDARDDCARLKEEKNTQTKLALQLREELTAVRQDLSKERKQRAEAERDRLSQAERIATLQARLDAHSAANRTKLAFAGAEVAKEREEREATRKELIALRERSAAAEEQVGQQKKEAARLRAELSQKERLLQQLKQDVAQLEGSLAEERGRVAELESHIRKAGGDLTRLPVAGARPAVHHVTATAAATVVQR